MKNRLKNNGFTLLDVIFSIGIIMVGLIVVLGLFQYVIVSARVSEERFVAVNLAQEGIEIVRSIRDSNWLRGDPWDQGLSSCTDCSSSDHFRVQYDSDSLLPYSAEKLKIDSSGYYSYEVGAPDTKFERTIYITTLTAADCMVSEVSGENECISVISEVKWPSFGGEKTLVIEDMLYNWR